MEVEYKDYRHNPAHLFVPGATYMVTAATYGKQKLFDTEEGMSLLTSSVLHNLNRFGWAVTAYVVLPKEAETSYRAMGKSFSSSYCNYVTA